MTYRVMFVCAGNICRSPMAAAVFRSRLTAAGLGDRVTVDSAGLHGQFAGYTADTRAQAVLADAGYDTEHTARAFRPHWLRSRDLILAAHRSHARALRLRATSPEHVGKVQLLRAFDPHADNLDVPDPYRGDRATFLACLHMIEAACDGLLDALQTDILTEGN